MTTDFKESITFIKNVRNIIRERGYTNRDFERKCRLCGGYLSRAVYNGRGISLQSAINMARELNVSLDDMIVDQSDRRHIYWETERRMAMIDLQIAELQAKKAKLNLLMQNHDKEDRDSDERERRTAAD